MDEFLKLVLRGLPRAIPLCSHDEGGHGTHPLLPPFAGEDMCDGELQEGHGNGGQLP